MTSVVQHRVRTGDGITLAAEYYPHDGDRPVVFLLHGGGQNRHAWTTSARRLQSRGYSVVAYDTRGHGDSDWDPAGRYDVERLATDLLAVRDHFSANTPPAVVGASLGNDRPGRAPARIRGVVGGGDPGRRHPAVGVRGCPSRRDVHGRPPRRLRHPRRCRRGDRRLQPASRAPRNLDGLHKVLRQRPDGRWVWRWDPAFVHSNFDFLRDGAAAGTEQFDAISHLLIDGARRVTAPTLLVRGLLSDVVSQATVEEFTHLVPHAETVDVSGTGHMIAGDDNDAFTAAVTDFLDRCTL